ncbi:fluoride efflux transporter FluC [Herbiconiux liangxiaofengii]|uniref:fluoride efflux transporter FluC n=1 Tax=Herbiconiux liangxiaofengii TaxID=3342795 RepID=UPI0035BAF614
MTHPPRPDHRSWSAALMVFIGGAAGTVSREGLDLATPGDRLLYTTFLINIVGSFTLAVLYAALRSGAEAPAAERRLRLLVGTGYLGGFTTYGSFAVGVAAAGIRGSSADAILYAVGSVVLGVGAALIGRWVVERATGRRPGGTRPAPETGSTP